ncbi:MAG TPA: hypothetical protein VHL53_02185, partial [Acidimicrobiia bacterium]|nr:hypothetical protein [Acidimicrobiia bacterium]
AAALRDVTRSADNPTVATRDPSTPSPSAPAQSRDPSAPLLAGLVVTDADVAPKLSVAGLQGGNGLTQPTLDLCNGHYPSETQRSARLQVAAIDSQARTHLSTEAVLYTSSAGTTAAFQELEDTARSCPPTPVDSPVGEPTVTTKFNPAPDAAWPQTPSVERLAFSFETTSADTGETNRSVAVFLRRGRALVGVYFSDPDSAITVAGRSTIPDIVTVFANRLAKLPVAAVSTTA